jgi:hypothetical protein
VSDAFDPKQETYFLDPIACRHREESRRMILRAASMTPPGEAIILGGGACDEIPLAELLERYTSVTLNDENEAALTTAVESLPADDNLRSKLRIQVADLSGMTESALQHIDEAILHAATPEAAAEAMAAAITRVKPAPLPIVGRFDLIVCSCVLSQLHFSLTHGAAARFAARFSGHEDVLQESEPWTAALQRVARDMEERLIAHLATVITDDGLLYLSESAQVCFLQLAPDGRWQTQGTYRMLRTKDLADYVSERFEIVGRNRWEWVVKAPQTANDTGRLFDVQALVLKRPAK